MKQSQEERLKKGFWHFFFFFPFRLHSSSSSCLLLYTIHVSIAPASEKKRNEGNHQNFFSFFSMKSYHARNKLDGNLQPRKIFKKKFFFLLFQCDRIFFLFFPSLFEGIRRIIFKEQIFFRVIRKQQKEIRYWRNWEH